MKQADTLRVMIGFSAGSVANNVARLIAPTLGKALGCSIDIELMPGSNGALCAQHVARAAPDGRTVLIAMQPYVIDPLLHPGAPQLYDLIADFAPVALLAKKPDLLAVSKSLGVGSVAELISHARARPEKLIYASSSIGGAPHLAGALFCAMAGIDMQLRVYKESDTLFADLEAGRVDLTFNNILSVLPLAQRGSIRMLGVTGAKRTAILPDVPTLAEAALPGYELMSWMGILAPAATPKATLLQLNAGFNRTMQSAEIASALIARGTEPMAAAPEALTAHIKTEQQRWGSFIKAHGAAFQHPQ